MHTTKTDAMKVRTTMALLSFHKYFIFRVQRS